MPDYEFTVVIEKDEDGRFVDICPALRGCYTERETEAEARHLIEDAIRLHVESRRSCSSADEHPESMKCHSERSEESCSARGTSEQGPGRDSSLHSE